MLEEDHKICEINGLPNSFFKSTRGVEVLSNFDRVFHSFVNEFPLSGIMDHDQLVFTYKILLQQQLDVYWYSGFKQYDTTLEIYNDKTLVDFRNMSPKFNYLPLKAGQKDISKGLKLYLNIINSPLKYCNGLTLPFAPVAMYNFLNNLCTMVGFSLVVTSAIRSKEFQEQLISKGLITPNESSHLYGYTVDLEKKWLEKFRRDRYLRVKAVLNQLEESGEIVYIDYGSIWHICLSPCFINKYLT